MGRLVFFFPTHFYPLPNSLCRVFLYLIALHRTRVIECLKASLNPPNTISYGGRTNSSPASSAPPENGNWVAVLFMSMTLSGDPSPETPLPSSARSWKGFLPFCAFQRIRLHFCHLAQSIDGQQKAPKNEVSGRQPICAGS